LSKLATVRRPLAAFALVGSALTIGGGSAAAQSLAAPQDPPPRVAVVTPLLGVFEFGSGSGLPLMCSVSGGALLSGADQTPLGGQAIAPGITQVGNGCDVMSTSGNDFFRQAIDGTRGLAVVNPVVNPVLATTASSLEKTGTDDAQLIAPAGPTVAGLGGLLKFLQGT
jgi:hypothetical protein